MMRGHEFDCGLSVSEAGLVRACPMSAKFAWQKALVDIQLFKHGAVHVLRVSELFQRAEQELALVANDKNTLIMLAAKQLWRGTVIDGMINGLHHPTECPHLWRYEEWGSFPCEKCHPAMAATWDEASAAVKRKFMNEAAEGPHLEWEMAITMNMMMAALRKAANSV